jgi:hypothetical protein
MTSTTAAAISLAMLLGSATSVLHILRHGASKDTAEALVWTVGGALAIQYAVGKNNN